MQNEHGLCEGNVIRNNSWFKNNKNRICECQCHDNMYKLLPKEFRYAME